VIQSISSVTMYAVLVVLLLAVVVEQFSSSRVDCALQ
jgi:hypothetical protein